MTDIFTLLPKNHFGPTMDLVITKLLAGQSVAVYGMPSIGRVFFLKIAQNILNDQKPSVTTLLFSYSPLIKHFDRVIQQTIHTTLAFTSKVPFEKQLEQYLEHKHLVIIINQADDLITYEPKVYTLLDRWRDLYRDRLSVLSDCGYQILTNPNAYAEFGGSIFANQIKIPLFDLAGTQRILLTNSTGLPFSISEKEIQTIYHLSGGNAGLIKYLSQALQNHGSDILDNHARLLRDAGLLIKLNELTHVVLSVSKDILSDLGIIKNDGTIFSPLLAEYLKTYETNNIAEIVPGLSCQEKKLLTYFLANKGKLVDKDRLAFLMGLTDDTFSLWAIYKAISRLKTKITSRYLLKAVKDQGYLLTDK